MSFKLKFRDNPETKLFRYEFLLIEDKPIDYVWLRNTRLNTPRNRFIWQVEELFRAQGGSLYSQWWPEYDSHVFATPDLHKALIVKLQLEI